MSYKQLFLSLSLSLLVVTICELATVNGCEILDHPVTTHQMYQAVFNGIRGTQRFLRDARHNESYILPHVSGEREQLYRELKFLTDIYEAQDAIANGLEMQEVLDSIVTDACSLIGLKVDGNVQCSTYAEVLDLKLALDIGSIMDDAFNEVKAGSILRDHTLMECGDVWLQRLSSSDTSNTITSLNIF